MRRALNAYYNVLVGLMVVLLMALTVVVSYQVCSRYVDFVPRYLWTEEVARFCFTWVVFLGAAIAVRQGTHFTVDVLPQSLSPKAQQALKVLVLLAIAVCAAVLVFGGLRFVESGMTRISTTSGIRLAWVYVAIPFAGVSMLVFVMEQLIDLMRGREVQETSREEIELDKEKQ